MRTDEKTRSRWRGPGYAASERSPGPVARVQRAPGGRRAARAGAALLGWAVVLVAAAVPGAARPAPAPAATSARSQTSSTSAAVPVAVALDPALTVPRPGDSSETLAARQQLKTVIADYQRAGQDYDLAANAASAAQTRLVAARLDAARAQERYRATHADFVELIQSQYMGGDPTGPLSAAATLLVADSPTAVLDDMAMQQQMDNVMSSQVTEAQQAAAQLAAAQDRVREAVGAALAAVGRAAAVRSAAAVSVRRAQTLVARLHTSDVRAAEAALEAAAASAGGPAAAMKAQTLATGAATEADYARATNPAAVIAIAADAMLEQAVGLRKAPLARAGIPRFTVPTAATPVDEQAVMGPAPNLGGIAYTGRAGELPSAALTPFDGIVSHDNWPNPGVGLRVAGTAPLRPANGTTVHPVIPAPGLPETSAAHHHRRAAPRPVLRAEVAVSTALAQLGSPYVWDAAGPDTFDCSGLTLWAWGHAGVSLEHYTGAQVMQGHRVEPNELLPGDLILFGATLHHVGMYLGAGFMIDAPDTGQYVKIEPIAADRDFAIAIRP